MQLYYGPLAWIVLVMERWWSALGASENHDAPTFKKSAPRSSQNHTALLTYSDGDIGINIIYLYCKLLLLLLLLIVLILQII